MKRRGVVLYDVYFPIWLQLMVPAVMIRVLAVNYAINAVVLRLALGAMSAPRAWKRILTYSVPATVLGFVADIAGLWVFEGYVRGRYEPGPAAVDPGLLVLIAVAGVLVGAVNYILSGYLLHLDRRQRLVLAVVMGVVTAPWLVLLDRTYNLISVVQALANAALMV